MRGNDAVNDAQHPPHDLGPAGKQETQLKREAQHPLTHGLFRQYFINQQGGTFGHPPRPTARAETATLTAESDRCSAWQDSQRTRRKPCSSRPLPFLPFLFPVSLMSTVHSGPLALLCPDPRLAVRPPHGAPRRFHYCVYRSIRPQPCPAEGHPQPMPAVAEFQPVPSLPLDCKQAHKPFGEQQFARNYRAQCRENTMTRSLGLARHGLRRRRSRSRSGRSRPAAMPSSASVMASSSTSREADGARNERQLETRNRRLDRFGRNLLGEDENGSSSWFRLLHALSRHCCK